MAGSKGWVPSWLRSNEEKEGEGENKHELPPEIEERFKKIDTVDTKLSSFEERLKSLDSITAFIDDEKKAREDAKKAREEAARREVEKKNTPSEDELIVLMQTDPRKALEYINKPNTDAVLMVKADTIRREVLEDNSEKFPYYTGDIKAEINKILRSQSLNFQNDPVAVENTYYTVVGRMHKDIEEGKVKSRFATSTPPHREVDNRSDREKVEIKVTPDIERAARLTGLAVKDYVELLRKDEGVEIV